MIRKVSYVRTGVFLLCALILASGPVIAANYQIYMGEGKPEASLSLSNAKYFSISLAQCAKSQNETTVNVVLIVDEKATVSPAVAQLRNGQPDAKRNMDLCLNSHCKSYAWEYQDDFGYPSWWMPLMIDPRREKIYSVQIIVPNDNTKYAFQGDVDGILKKICR